MSVIIQNGWGNERVGNRQRKLLSRMALNEGEWNIRWWTCREDRMALKGMVEKGYVERVLVGDILTWRITNKFWDRIIIKDEIVR